MLPAASQPGPDSASLHCKPANGLEEMSRDPTDLWPAPVNGDTHTHTLSNKAPSTNSELRQS